MGVVLIITATGHVNHVHLAPVKLSPPAHQHSVPVNIKARQSRK